MATLEGWVKAGKVKEIVEKGILKSALNPAYFLTAFSPTSHRSIFLWIGCECQIVVFGKLQKFVEMCDKGFPKPFNHPTSSSDKVYWCLKLAKPRGNWDTNPSSRTATANTVDYLYFHFFISFFLPLSVHVWVIKSSSTQALFTFHVQLTTNVIFWRPDHDYSLTITLTTWLLL